INGLGERLGERLGEKWTGKHLTKRQVVILLLIKKDKYVPITELARISSISTTAVEKNINRLKEKGLLKRIGPDKGGHWECA
ncbi:MAG: winged helix-turn-helix transcriptional regulator, partial [archaeon]